MNQEVVGKKEVLRKGQEEGMDLAMFEPSQDQYIESYLDKSYSDQLEIQQSRTQVMFAATLKPSLWKIIPQSWKDNLLISMVSDCQSLQSQHYINHKI